MKTTVLPKTVSLQAHDLTGIRMLDVRVRPTSVRVNGILRVEVTPQDGSRNPILGTPPAPFTVT